MEQSASRRVGRRTVIRSGASAALAAVLAGCTDLFEDDDAAATLDADTDTGTDTATDVDASTDSVETDVAAGDARASVIVVGAGPAGISAAALLTRAGVDVRVLEAGPTYGGRIRHDRDFVDFPISLGGEWLHEAPSELSDIADRVVDVALAGYAADDRVDVFDGELFIDSMGDDVDSDLKFVGSSWLDFFETHLIPDIEDRMTFGVEVTRVDHTGDDVVLTDREGNRYTADQVVVTVPIKLLQDERVEFDPPLPDRHLEAIGRADIWGGMKVFVEFSERFYPTFLAFTDSDTDDGQRLWYDAAHGQDSDANVFGLFAVGAPAERYQAVDEGDELRDLVLAELDEIYDGAASRTYLRHIAQNWSTEPFAGAAYLADEADWRIPATLSERFSDRVFLAGDAYTSHDDWSAVDDAARSARDVVREILA